MAVNEYGKFGTPIMFNMRKDVIFLGQEKKSISKNL
jgi:hypothetical protein